MPRMHILLSNDDGYQAAGLVALAETLRGLGTISVVAPDRDRSGASNSLTLDSPIRAQVQENGFVRVEGTPTDCVHLAITGLLQEEPDMVVAGINPGANMGDDVLYSGTVAAATEGRFLGLPSIAISIAAGNPRNYQTATRVALDLVKGLREMPLAADSILNVNIPDVPYAELAGIQATRLGHRHRAEPVICEHDPRGKPIYWVGPAGPEQDAGPGTDFYAVRNNFVSITPIQIDLTRHSALEDLNSWLKKLP